MSNPQQPTPYQAAPETTGKRGNGLGVASLIVGILALIGAFIPILNYGAWFLGLVGLVLGIVGLVLKGRTKGTAIAGTIISAVSILLSIILSIAYTVGFAAAVKTEMDKSSAAAAAPVTVTYEVNGDSTDASITYATLSDGKSGVEQATAQTLPWSKELTVTKGGDFDFKSFTLTGSNGQTGGDISCKITVDGKVVSNQTSTGPYATVSCNSSSWSGTDSQ
ncbi:MmpS family transport accessory protein [Leifsonia sp. NCR5]|uniref:MmpS family transport accessory protein n=1 Tax=Leifsonia sp. NCR5 TaxID=1978342 RepID=UPI000A1902A0|nr:MmpS family transport accessory protein [Leifsonia sp. NCR5]